MTIKLIVWGTDIDQVKNSCGYSLKNIREWPKGKYNIITAPSTEMLTSDKQILPSDVSSGELILTKIIFPPESIDFIQINKI